MDTNVPPEVLMIGQKTLFWVITSLGSIVVILVAALGGIVRSIYFKHDESIKRIHMRVDESNKKREEMDHTLDVQLNKRADEVRDKINDLKHMVTEEIFNVRTSMSELHLDLSGKMSSVIEDLAKTTPKVDFTYINIKDFNERQANLLGAMRTNAQATAKLRDKVVEMDKGFGKILLIEQDLETIKRKIGHH